MRYRLQLILLFLALALVALVTMPAMAASPADAVLLPLANSPPLLSANEVATTGNHPTAVVLSTFSADIRGPSRALWAASTCLLLIGSVVVRQLYTRYE